MMLVGCDLNARKQYVATLNTETGEVQERRLVHGGDAVEAFYGSLAGLVIVGSRPRATRSGFSNGWLDFGGSTTVQPR